MAETPSSPAPAAKAKPALKKGALVRVNQSAYAGSLEAGASDPQPSLLYTSDAADEV